MTTYNTGNPVPSADARDRYDNSQTFDEVINGALTYYPNRVGQNVLSLKGMQSLFNAEQADRASAFSVEQDRRDDAFQQFIESSGWSSLGPYAAGVTITSHSQTVDYMEQPYQLKPSIPVSLDAPYVTTGDWATESVNFKLVGDNSLRQDLAGPDGSQNVSFIADGADAVPIDLQSLIRDMSISVKYFGAKGDTVTDDTAAIRKADAWCSANGHSLFFPRGGYRITGSIDSLCDWWSHSSPNIGTFSLEDDKVFMTPGTKQKVPGSWILVDVPATSYSTFTTLRTDQFSSFTYAIKKTGRTPGFRQAPGIQKVGVILNFDYKTAAGVVTLPNNDQSADCDCGLLLHNVELKSIASLSVGGYWKKAGIVHFGVDPDNTNLTDMHTMGDFGLAIIGDTTGTNSGFNSIGSFIGANDHHSRSADPANEKWGKGALYIDIPSATGLGSRNGISFIGGAITTKTNYPIQLDRCGAVNFTNVVMENATQPGSGTGMGQAGGTKRFIGTARTGDIGFINVRLNAEQIKGPGCLLETAPNATITIVGGNRDYGLEVWHGLSGIRMNAGSEQNFQLTNDPSSITTGVRLRRTGAGTLEMTINNSRVSAWNEDGLIFEKLRSVNANIAAAAVSVEGPVVRLVGGTTDLNTITPVGGINKVKLIANTSSDIITLKNTGGNIRIGSDYVLSGFKVINLYFNGTFWLQDGGRQ